MPGRPWNYHASYVLAGLGAVLWVVKGMDLGLTLILLGVLNYGLYKKKSGWVLV